jgi:hypothetical protein
MQTAPCMSERVWLVVMALTIQPAAAALMQLPGVPGGLGCCVWLLLPATAHTCLPGHAYDADPFKSADAALMQLPGVPAGLGCCSLPPLPAACTYGTCSIAATSPPSRSAPPAAPSPASPSATPCQSMPRTAAHSCGPLTLAVL